MRITVPDEIMRLTVPTCTPSRDNPFVIVSSLEVGGPDLHIFVSVQSVLQVGCLRDSLQEHHRTTDLARWLRLRGQAAVALKLLCCQARIQS